MPRKDRLFLLTAALTLGLVCSVQAAKPIVLKDSSFAQIRQNFALLATGTALGKSISGQDSLNVISEHTDNNKIMHIRLQQHYAGFPVYGGYALVHRAQQANSLATSGSPITMNGTVYKDLRSELAEPEASFVSNARSVLKQFKTQYAKEQINQEQVTPIIYIDAEHQAHWAYKLSILVQYQDKIPERPTAIIDAKTNQVFVQWNDMKTRRAAALGTGFGGNQKVGFYQFGSELPYLDMMRDSLTEMCFMENRDVRVIDMQHRYSSQRNAMSFSCPTNASNIYLTGYKQDGYDKENGAASPVNDALYVGYVIKHMYAEWYHTNALSKPDGTPRKLIMRVHYGYGYENAYWDGEQMTFGDGGSMMYPLVSIGVGAHEISHGFTEQHSNLEYYGQSGGMNEAFSDMAAQAAEYYSTGKNSWQIGGEIMKENSGLDVLRYMDHPSRDHESIDSADQYYPGLDVHHSSGVYNHLFYILANQPHWTTQLAFNVMVKANMDYWTPYSTFEEGGEGLVNAISDLMAGDSHHQSYPVTAVCDVKKSLLAVKIATPLDVCFPEKLVEN